MVIKYMHNYTYRGELRRIYIERDGDDVRATRYESGQLTDSLGTYLLIGGELVGDGGLTAAQRVTIAARLAELADLP